jgi:ribosomal protein S12 methylthiotransferase
VGVFTYSHEEGTRAYAMEDDVPAAVKAERRDAVMQMQRDLVAARLAGRIGGEVRVMIDGPSPESELVLSGRLEGQAPDIDAVVYLDGCDPSEFRAGEVVPAVVTGANGYDLVARPLRHLAG